MSKTTPTNQCHPERPHVAKAFSKACYYRNLKEQNPEWAADLKRRLAEYHKTERGIENRKRSGRKCHLKTKFGISLEEYDRMLSGQGGVCAICSGTNDRNGRGGKVLPLSVDHCHDTGRIRGLLCATCNTAIHKAERDIQWFDAARMYLQNK